MIIRVNADGSATAIVGSLKDGLPIDLESLGTVRQIKRQGVLIEANGEWYADMFLISGPVLGPFPNREQAIAAEIDWLRGNVL